MLSCLLLFQTRCVTDNCRSSPACVFFANSLKRSQEGHKVVFVLRREVEIETHIVKIDSVQQRSRRAIVKIGRAPSQASKNRAFDLADMIEPAIDQSLTEIACGLAVVCPPAGGRVLSTHGDLWQVAHIQAAQVDGAVGWARVAGPNVQWGGEGVVAYVRRVVASAAGSPKRRNAA